MSWSFSEWSPDDTPGIVLDVTRPGAWDDLAHFYAGATRNEPLQRIIEIAKALNVVNVVVERRYIDLDWRSEHAHYYGHTFRRYPSVCHRLHFFTTRVPDDLIRKSSRGRVNGITGSVC